MVNDIYDEIEPKVRETSKQVCERFINETIWEDIKKLLKEELQEEIKELIYETFNELIDDRKEAGEIVNIDDMEDFMDKSMKEKVNYYFFDILDKIVKENKE